MDAIHKRQIDQIRLDYAENDLLLKARNGDNSAKARLLRFAADGLSSGATIPPGIAKFVSDGLRRVYDERVGERAFGIQRKRGEKDTRRAQLRGHWFAAYIEARRRYDHATLQNAVSDAAQLFNVSEDTAKGGWKQNHRLVKREFALLSDTEGVTEHLRYSDRKWRELVGVKK